jgi:phosphatidylserine/phosphatidylglycerophosphate/cardiolipin synthase-like enzyme/V8-like Glu-specific endopeptidase
MVPPQGSDPRPGAPSSAQVLAWLKSLARRDPSLHSDLVKRLVPEGQEVFDGLSPESALHEIPRLSAVTLETIVRAGRPALPVKHDAIDFRGGLPDDVSRKMIERLKANAAVIERVLPFVGRIDVANHQSSLSYVGTGWLVAPGIVLTNRHVAELLARESGERFVFRSGRFGDPLSVSIDYRHEMELADTDPASVTEVIWIERDECGPDVAFLKVDGRRSGTRDGWIELADEDALPDTDVAVVGYPARAPASIISDQEWMDRIYGGVYDVKRVAPGMLGEPTGGWVTHDCTTLGGNSGSAVIEMKQGRAVALHFAGLYLVENYAVPASTIKRYLRDRPWQNMKSTRTPADVPARDTAPAVVSRRIDLAPAIGSGQVSVTIPLTITVLVGEPSIVNFASATRGSSGITADEPELEAAALRLFTQQRGQGMVAIYGGYVLENGRLTDIDCLVVKADPAKLSDVRARVPASFDGYPVDVRVASLDDYEFVANIVSEAVTSIAYNDEDRTGTGFSFAEVTEPMKGLIHVGPERSWTVLSEFLAQTKRKLVSSMYEFHANHVADAVEKQLDEGATLQLVLATQSRDPKGRAARPGEFDRSARFERWARDFGRRFKTIFVPLGTGGLVANAYHIKVSVRDDRVVWLSSGNWKSSSQPVIPNAQLNDAKAISRAGNREWHVVLDSPTLAERFQNHILADFERSLDLGGDREAPDQTILLDVPAIAFEALDLEAAATAVLEPLAVDRTLRVTPLLTPDGKGKVYCDAVLGLIASARTQLLFQNQYIKMAGATSGFLKALVDALVDRATKIDDVRIILRSGDSLVDDVSALKRRGVDPARIKKLRNTHTKGIVVDGARVLVGSHNWSAPGVTLNRDASLIFEDEAIAQYYAAAFELDWNRATDAIAEDLQPEGVPRLASGDGPPTGFVRMTLAEYLEG